MFFLAFATLSTLFVLKDGPVMRRFINRHMGVPEPVANVVTANIAKSLRSYFLGVTIIAAFNGVVDRRRGADPRRPARGDDRGRHLRGRLRPVRRRLGGRRLRGADRARHRGHDAALVMAVVALLANGALQQLIQPFVMGATLGLNPLVVLVVTIGAGALFGMVGLTLAAPLTSAAVHIANELRDRDAVRRRYARRRRRICPPRRSRCGGSCATHRPDGVARCTET